MKKLLSFAVIGILSQFSFSQTAIVAPEIDNAIFEESTNSSGAGRIFAGQNGTGNNRRALIQFDIAAAIPAGATITDVTLTLNNDNISPSAVPTDFSLYSVLTEWGEGTSIGPGGGGSGGAPTTDDATWIDAMFGSTTWTTAGGDFGAALATTTLPASTGSFNWNSVMMVANVQAWLDAPATNFGWILRGEETTTNQARRFGSKELGTAPVLIVDYICAAPMAVCQDINVYLDAAGSFTISDSDLDGGSTAVCGISGYSASQTVFGCSDVGAGPEMIITAVYDGPLTGGTPKGIELYVREDISDLSNWGVGFANNGGGTDGEEFTFPAGAVSAGTFLYVASEDPMFTSFFGFAPDYVSGFASINGDDAIELFKGGTVVDLYGDVDVDGTTEPWEYLDGWAYRNDLTGPETPYVVANWTYSGVNALDGETTNASASTPVPIGTFTPSVAAGVNVTLTVTGGGGGTDNCVSTVTVFDTLAPTMNCVATPTITLDATGKAYITPATLDGGTTDGCGIDSMYTSVDSVVCSDAGVMMMTLYAVDFYGNLDSCTSSVTVDASSVMTVDISTVTDVTCIGDGDGAIDITVTGGSGTNDFDWDYNGAGFGDPEDPTGLDGGTFNVVVEDDQGCQGTAMATVNEPGAVDTLVTVAGGTLSANASAVTYQWYDCTSMTIVAGETSQNFTPTADGSYACIIDDGGCIDTSSCYTIAGVGLEESENNFAIYPNPADDILTISSPGSKGMTLSLIEITGKQVLRKTVATNTYQLDVSGFETGVYLLEIKQGGSKVVKRLTIL